LIGTTSPRHKRRDLSVHARGKRHHDDFADRRETARRQDIEEQLEALEASLPDLDLTDDMPQPDAEAGFITDGTWYEELRLAEELRVAPEWASLHYSIAV
jgi:hypothetical protein